MHRIHSESQCFASDNIMYQFCHFSALREQKALACINQRCQEIVIKWREDEEAIRREKGVICLLPYALPASWETLSCVSRSCHTHVLGMLWEKKKPTILPLFSTVERLAYFINSKRCPEQKREMEELLQNLKELGARSIHQILSYEIENKEKIVKILLTIEDSEMKILKSKFLREAPLRDSPRNPTIALRKTMTPLFNDILTMRQLFQERGSYIAGIEKVEHFFKMGHLKPATALAHWIDPKKAEDLLSLHILNSLEERIESHGLRSLIEICRQIETAALKNDLLYRLFDKCIESGYLGVIRSHVHLLEIDAYKKAISSCLAAAYLEEDEIREAVETLHRFGYPLIRMFNPDSPHIEKTHHPSDSASPYILCDLVKRVEEREERASVFSLILEYHKENQGLLTHKLVNLLSKWKLKSSELEIVKTIALSIPEKTILAKTLLLVSKIYYKKQRYKEADALIQSALSTAQEASTLEHSHRILIQHLRAAEKEIQKKLS